ncbi:MAG: hypothetical protein SH817_14375 [Leptospira sp.]|nr:hypothetical protein [Leptospira sp.]
MAPRKFNSEIEVDDLDRWIFRENEITQNEILAYFRQNLKQTQTGIYIQNVFGELSEHGFVNVIGYPCHVLGIETKDGSIFFHCDDLKTFEFPDFEIYQTPKGELIGIHSESPLIKYRFNWNAAGDLGEYLEEEGDATYLKIDDIYMELPIYLEAVSVPVPISFD